MNTREQTAAPGELSPVEKLTPEHNVKEFRSGSHALDYWMRKYALKNQSLSNSPQTYVVHRVGRVVAYYSLVYGEVSLEACPPNIRDSMPSSYPVPVIKMARLAVDQRDHGNGIGSALMKDAFGRIVAAAAIAGLRARCG